MIKSAEVQEVIRLLAREEWPGLYEIIAGLHTAHPDISEPARLDAVRSVLSALLERGHLQLGWLEWPEGRPPIPLEAPEAIRLLDDPRSWQAGERYPVLLGQP